MRKDSQSRCTGQVPGRWAVLCPGPPQGTEARDSYKREDGSCSLFLRIQDGVNPAIRKEEVTDIKEERGKSGGMV